MAHAVVATMIGGGLEMRSLSLAAVASRKLASFHGADGTPSRESAGNGPSGRGNDDREDDDDERRPLNFGI